MIPRIAVAVLVAANAFAGEYAILANGASMRVERHEIDGDNVRLYLEGGDIEFPAGAVVRFEQEYVAPAEPRQAAPAIPPKELVSQAAERWHLPPSFLQAVVKAESGYRTDAVSPKGAIGLMQLMPETARLLGADPKDPRQNVDAGARYLTGLLLKYIDDPYQVRKAVAAYNAGTAAVDRYDGVPPYPETIAYVERVIREWQKK
jgi:soluble lytic murein transglycosylase-like protein